MGRADNTATHFAGTDVSRDTLDACLLGPDGRTRDKPFPNAPAGFAVLRVWAERHAPGGVIHFGPEATGPYSGIATFLADASRLVGVANPARVRAHAQSAGQGNKTDPADARPIAEYTRDRKPRPWCPPPPEVRQVRVLVRRRDELRVMAAAEKNRVGSPGLTPAARKSIARVIRLLPKEADRVPAEAVIDADPRLAAGRGLLESVKGVGRRTAATVPAELPAVDRLPSAESAAAYRGLAPREFRSGKSVRRHTRLSKAGNARLRRAPYLPTLATIRSNPALEAFHERLLRAGKPRMQAVGACTRRLLMICYGVLKNRTPFDPARTSIWTR